MTTRYQGRTMSKWMVQRRTEVSLSVADESPGVMEANSQEILLAALEFAEDVGLSETTDGQFLVWLSKNDDSWQADWSLEDPEWMVKALGADQWAVLDVQVRMVDWKYEDVSDE